MVVQASYPLRVEAQLEPGLSRWLWLVKWFLAIPHFIVLAFLWIAFGVLTLVAFFAILFTGRYPRSIFEFNVGVLRWTWRVSDYAYGVLGTDSYPPFTLERSSEYPASLEVAYPERLSRGLVLVKWILAIPHLLIVAILGGGGTWLAWNTDNVNWGFWGGLIGLLVLIAAVILAITGSYPRQLFDLILGLNRWVLRVAAYVGLMTDQYPPFRLDMGGAEPDGGRTLTIPAPPSAGGEVTLPAPPPPREAGPGKGGWTGGRVTAVVIGSVLAVVSLALFSGGGFLVWAMGTQRDAQGFYSVDTERYTTSTYALTAQVRVTDEPGPSWLALRAPGWVLGSTGDETVRIRVRSRDGASVFVGIAPTDEVRGYLGGVERTSITDLGEPSYRTTAGTAPAGVPQAEGFWMVSDAGAGTRTMTWAVREGSWTVVVMNADGSRGIDVTADAGAKVPVLPWVTVGVFIGAVVFLILAVILIVAPIRRAGRAPR